VVIVDKDFLTLKDKIMFKKKSSSGPGIGSLLVAGLAAYGLYKYTKMTEQEKQEFIGGLKERGKKFYDENIPEELKKVFKSDDGDQGDQNTFGSSGTQGSGSFSSGGNSGSQGSGSFSSGGQGSSFNQGGTLGS
jgi:uncharacterized membrane protein YgcG